MQEPTTLEQARRQIAILQDQLRIAQAENERLKAAQAFEPLEPQPLYNAEIQARNEARAEKVRAALEPILEWVKTNLGYSRDEDDAEAEGLARLAGYPRFSPHFAIRFAMLVCEGHNYHDLAHILETTYKVAFQVYP